MIPLRSRIILIFLILVGCRNPNTLTTEDQSLITNEEKETSHIENKVRAEYDPKQKKFG